MSIEASGVQRFNQRFVRRHTYIHGNQRKIKYQGKQNGKQSTFKTGNQKKQGRRVQPVLGQGKNSRQ